MIFASTIFSRHAHFLSKIERKTLKELVTFPKRPGSPYSLYVAQRYEAVAKEFPMLTATSIMQRIGSEWKGLTEAEKAPFAQQFKSSFEKFKTESQAAMNTLTERQKTALKVLRKDRMVARGSLEKKSLGEEEKAFLKSLPKAPYSTARGLHTKLFMKGVKDVAPQMEFCVDSFKNLSKEDMGKLELTVKNDIERYRNELVKFLNQ